MSDADFRRRVLDAERAVNEDYQRELKMMREAMGKVGSQAIASASQRWTGPAPTPGPPIAIGPVIGRVALDREVEFLGRDFYLGPQYSEMGDVVVVCYAAPVASLFYQGCKSGDDRADYFLGTRTFTVQDDDLESFEDEIDDPSASDDLFPIRKTHLAIPSAPALVARPTEPATPLTAIRIFPNDDGISRPDPVIGAKKNESTRQVPAISTSDSPARGLPVVQESDVVRARSTVSLRAERSVMAAIERPRTGKLPSVLATLQPDQYRLVTWPSEKPLIIEGQPGTGKTIIATHRAAYLTNEERSPGPLERVLVVGPTAEYSQHIRGIERLTRGHAVELIGMPALLRRIAAIDIGDTNDRPAQYDTDRELARVITQCARRMRKTALITHDHHLNVRRFVDHFIVGDDLFADVLRKYPGVAPMRNAMRKRSDAVKTARFLPFFATVSLALWPIHRRDRYDHVIIDEAQDVRPLEWWILEQHLRDRATFTILGDMNQRHSDFTAATWVDLAVELELTDDDAKVQVETLEIGYRSTQEILKFANRLLPRGSRGASALTRGIPPKVTKVALANLAVATVDASAALAARYADGLIAVITTNPRSIGDQFRKRNWRPEAMNQWTDDVLTVRVFSPQSARGLEFDGVVVVEPAAFDQNVGRDGQLYTSLTRATKELTVVHSQPLPKVLRGK